MLEKISQKISACWRERKPDVIFMLKDFCVSGFKAAITFKAMSRF